MAAFVTPSMCSPSSGSSNIPIPSTNTVPTPQPPSEYTPLADPSPAPDSPSSEDETGLRPRYRRSKLLLTRRIYSLRVARTRANRASRPPPARAPPPAPSDAAPPLVAPPQSAHFRPEYYLEEAPAVPSYFFLRGVVPFPSRRRSGDPPARYLELRYGMVEPDSSLAADCANPRAARQIKRWYANAIRWRVLHKDFRPVMVLTPEQRIAGPAEEQAEEAGEEGQKQEVDGGELEGLNAISSTLFAPRWIEEDAVVAAQEPLPRAPLLLHGGSNIARALSRSPRVIVIGDIHGCIDEFQALLRLSDYQPGDQVILLGDLVAKGPDSVGVVQMARDVGARTVRGNHDHEVIRWCEASTKNVRSAMISLEHSRIANSLSAEDHAWLMDSPWFISSPETQHLFVHAGFIPGVKLTQQNPRLMMNMRSVLEDGTVTAKNVVDCEWAKLWRGPQTVIFGHDAHRGLQEHPFAKGIDTGCVYGGRLTAYILPERRYVSVAAKRSYIRERRFRGSRRD